MEPIDSHDAGTILRVSIITDLRISTETCEMDNVFPPDDLWLCSDTNTVCSVLNDLYSDV